MNYDLIIIGSGPAGQKGAIAAAKLGKSVAIVDSKAMLGGVSLHGGTIPSKTLREAILYLCGIRQRSFYGKDYAVKEEIDQRDLVSRVKIVEEREMAVIRSQLKRNGIAMYFGKARFKDEQTVTVDVGGKIETIQAEKFLIACGTRPARDPEIPFDGESIIDVDEILDLKQLPKKMIVMGAGVIGLEYASMFAALGIEVSIIERSSTVLGFVDKEIIDSLIHKLKEFKAVLLLGKTVLSVKKDADGQVVLELESGEKIISDNLLYAVGRQTNSDTLNLDALGIKSDQRGKIFVNENYQTEVSNVYAAGDVIGFPALAATSMEQGRLAACHMFDVATGTRANSLPYGIYTIPEISMIGKTEQELIDAGISYEVGTAGYDELAKGQILGANSGRLKILFDPDTLALLGVHIIGEQATELIHIGQAVLNLGGSIEYFRDTVFNYPTLAEAYKVAALHGLNKR